METSLSRQLKKLKAPQTSAFKETKKRVSFLYDESEANSVDHDTHFAVALSGLEALSTINPLVNSFRDTLFKEENKLFQRGLLSKEENENLDEEIKRFLFEILSPYFLLTATHKILEWLLVNYQIHEYNGDVLLISVLPYHETKLFSKVVQLVRVVKDKTSSWYWLISVAKNGIPLPKSALLNHCMSDRGFLTSLSDAVFFHTAQKQTTNSFVSFFTSLMVCIVERSPTEEVISIVFDYLNVGLKSKNSSIVISCYIIFVLLTHKTTLNENWLKKVMKKMSKQFIKSKQKATLQEPYMLTLIAITTNQKLEIVPRNVVASIDLDKMVQYPAKNSEFLCLSVLNYLIRNYEQDDNYEVLELFLKKVNCTQIVVEKCLLTILEVYKEKAVQNGKLPHILRTFERRFPSLFDATISKIAYKGAEDLLVSSMYLKVGKVFSNVCCALNHPNKEIRIAAILHLEAHSGDIQFKEDEIKQEIVSSLVTMIENVELDVLYTIFKCKNVLQKLFDDSKLIQCCREVLMQILSMIKEDKELNNEGNILLCKNIVCEISALLSQVRFKNEEEIFDTFLPFILPKSGSRVLFEQILGSKVVAGSELLLCLKKRVMKKNYDLETLVKELSLEISSFYVKGKQSSFLDIICESKIVGHQIYALYFLTCILEQTKDYDLYNRFSLKLIDICCGLLKSRTLKRSNVYSTTFDELVKNNIKYIERDFISEDILQFLLRNIANGITPLTKPGWLWHTSDMQNCYLFGLLNLLCELVFHKKREVQSLFRSLLRDFSDKVMNTIGISFFSSLWTNRHKPALQARSLSLTACFVKTKTSLTVEDSLSLFISLTSPSASVRMCAVNLLKALKMKQMQKLERSFGAFEQSALEICKVFSTFGNEISPNSKSWIENAVSYIADDLTPPQIKHGLLLLLKDCREEKLVMSYLPLLDSALDSPELPFNYEIITSIWMTIVDILTLDSRSKEKQFISYFFRVLKCHSFRKDCLKFLKPKWFKSIASENVKLTILMELLNLVLDEKDQKVGKKLSKLIWDGNFFVNLIDGLITTSEVGTSKTKRRRTSRVNMSIESDSWKKVLIVLEIVRNKDVLENSTVLMKNLFVLLNESFTTEEKPSLEYVRFLLLGAIRNCLNQSDCQQRLVDIQCVLESFRYSRQRETKREALLLINIVAPHFRKEILNNIMLVFGYIGNNMVQCDDQYSLQVMDETMSAIIPLLVQDDDKVRDSVIEVFIDAIKDIVAHRRLHLFRKLSCLLENEQLVWFIVYKLIERIESMNDMEKKDFIEFSRILVASYDILIQLNTFVTLIKAASLLDDGKTVIFGRKISYKDKQRDQIFQNIVSNVLHMLSSDEFRMKLNEYSWDQTESYFNELIQNLLFLIERITKNASGRRSISYVKTVNRILYKTMEKINELLPAEEMLSLIKSLLSKEYDGVQRKALEMFNSLLVNQNVSEIELSLGSLVKPLCGIAASYNASNNESLATNAQLAMLSIKLLAKAFEHNENNTIAFDYALKAVIEIGKNVNAKSFPNVTASAVLCLAQVSATLGVRAVQFVPTVVTITLTHFSEKSHIVSLSCITALSKITRHFSQFLTSNLAKILTMSCLAKCDNKEDTTFELKFKLVKKNISTTVPLRILVQTMETAYNELIAYSEESIISLLSIFYDALNVAEKTALEAIMQQLQKFIFIILDYRNLMAKSKSLLVVDAVEDKAIQCILVMVPKLSEITFRPFFFKLYDWAIRTKDGELKQRVITFYRIANQLADKLRSLFCVFAAPYIVNNCIQLLDTLKREDTDDQIRHSIVSNVLITLSKCFAFDNGSFASQERMEKLIPSIVNQLNNTYGTAEMQTYLTNECIAKCVQNIVRAVTDSTIVKDLQYKVLLNMRDNSAKIRYNALHIYHEFVAAMKGEYLPLLPEAVPFLAELHEDDSPEVQKLLVSVLHDIEEIVGEPISEYF